MPFSLVSQSVSHTPNWKRKKHPNSSKFQRKNKKNCKTKTKRFPFLVTCVKMFTFDQDTYKAITKEEFQTSGKGELLQDLTFLMDKVQNITYL